MARTGKIASLPHALREQVCLRLFNGEKAPTILRWLNAQPEAITVWARDFKDMPASDENLSQWRGGGYDDWLRQRQHVDSLKTLASFSKQLVRAGGSLADGAAEILSGQILTALETGANMAVPSGDHEEGDDPHERLVSMAKAVSAMQRGAAAKGKLELDRKKVAQKDQQLALDREKFESQTITKFLDWAKSPDAIAILDSGKPRHIQMDRLRELMFGTTQKEVTDAV